MSKDPELERLEALLAEINADSESNSESENIAADDANKLIVEGTSKNKDGSEPKEKPLVNMKKSVSDNSVAIDSQQHITSTSQNESTTGSASSADADKDQKTAHISNDSDLLSTKNDQLVSELPDTFGSHVASDNIKLASDSKKTKKATPNDNSNSELSVQDSPQDSLMSSTATKSTMAPETEHNSVEGNHMSSEMRKAKHALDSSKTTPTKMNSSEDLLSPRRDSSASLVGSDSKDSQSLRSEHNIAAEPEIKTDKTVLTPKVAHKPSLIGVAASMAISETERPASSDFGKAGKPDLKQLDPNQSERLANAEQDMRTISPTTSAKSELETADLKSGTDLEDNGILVSEKQIKATNSRDTVCFKSEVSKSGNSTKDDSDQRSQGPRMLSDPKDKAENQDSIEANESQGSELEQNQALSPNSIDEKDKTTKRQGPNVEKDNGAARETKNLSDKLSSINLKEDLAETPESDEATRSNTDDAQQLSTQPVPLQTQKNSHVEAGSNSAVKKWQTSSESSKETDLNVKNTDVLPVKNESANKVQDQEFSSESNKDKEPVKIQKHTKPDTVEEPKSVPDSNASKPKNQIEKPDDLKLNSTQINNEAITSNDLSSDSHANDQKDSTINAEGLKQETEPVIVEESQTSTGSIDMSEFSSPKSTDFRLVATENAGNIENQGTNTTAKLAKLKINSESHEFEQVPEKHNSRAPRLHDCPDGPDLPAMSDDVHDYPKSDKESSIADTSKTTSDCDPESRGTQARPSNGMKDKSADSANHQPSSDSDNSKEAGKNRNNVSLAKTAAGAPDSEASGAESKQTTSTSSPDKVQGKPLIVDSQSNETPTDCESVAADSTKPEVQKGDENTVYLYMSMASGVRGSMSRFNRASTILRSYGIEFVPVEITLDERAKRQWKYKGVAKNKVLPAVFRDNDLKCDFNELVEANEIEDVEDLIFDGL